jgi:TonB family protein
MLVRSAARSVPALLATIVLAFLTGRIRAQTTEPELKARLIHKPLYLSTPWRQDSLKFDAAGNPQIKYDLTTFTLAGIDINRVEIKKDKLEIQGNRIGLEFTPAPKRVAVGESIRIEIDAPSGTDFAPALDRIFTEGLSALVPSLPAYWQPYAQKYLIDAPILAGPKPATAVQSHPAESSTGVPPRDPNSPLPHPIGHVSAPEVLSMADPSYTPAAHHLKYGGLTKVHLYVGADGLPSHVVIITPLGLGLDEQAMAAVYQYRFKPATRDGEPIRVELNIEVNFRIF